MLIVVEVVEVLDIKVRPESN